uniref:Uncharacterized protein n=1 Tax=Sus scrofa TaxID=9823 RepID=A0A5G2Q9Z5_PIG
MSCGRAASQGFDQVLSQASAGRAQSTLLLNNEGSLLNHSTYRDVDARSPWPLPGTPGQPVAGTGNQVFNEHNLKFIFIDCLEGRAQALVQYPQEPLIQIAAPSKKRDDHLEGQGLLGKTS